MMFLTNYRSIRASEILSTHGYSLRAYAMQRSVKEQLWVLCAAANKMATFGELFGWEGIAENADEEKRKEQIFKNRLNIENETREKICGRKSGLSERTQAQLLVWERLFNVEVHRGLFSMFRASSLLLQHSHYTSGLGPEPDELSDAMFLNRSMELNWLSLRLLPFVRRTDTRPDAKWDEKWNLLENSFQFMFDGFSELGKAIAPAFYEMLEHKFKFDPKTFYSENGG